MGRITWELIRKKAEHHDGLLEDLEELSLHQLHLEKLEVLGRFCPRLKILYLQNNLIPRLENLRRLSSLQYLNVALNNITSIPAEIAKCEKLRKLDLTLNFIDVHMLESSISALQPLEHLDELYLTGNPCTAQESFPRCRQYIVHRLPRLQKLDGNEVTRGERLQAAAAFPEVERELRELAEKKRAQLGAQASAAAAATSSDGKDDDDRAEEAERAAAAAAGSGSSSTSAAKSAQVSSYTPESRLQMHRESEAQDRAKEEAKKRDAQGNQPPDMWAEAQKKMNAKVTQADLEALGPNELPKQRNMGKWEFDIRELPREGKIVVDIAVQRFLDTSLIDVDVHPLWVQCLIKGKNLLLHLPGEVAPELTRVQRVADTGHLLLTCTRVRKVTETTTRMASSGGSAGDAGPSAGAGVGGREDDEEEAELRASEAATTAKSSMHSGVVDLSSSNRATAASASSSSRSATSHATDPRPSSAFQSHNQGGGLNQVLGDFRHLGKKRREEEKEEQRRREEGALMREVAVTRSATLEEARVQRQMEAAQRAQREADASAEEQRAELERLGLDDTGVPDLE